jgi:uncharacterized protein (UPF0218 family)
MKEKMVADAKTKRKYKEQKNDYKRKQLSKVKNGAVAELKLK